MNVLPSINPKQETEKIVNFLKNIRKKTGIDRVVIGLSGGIDSTVVYYLLKKTYKKENIISVSLPYDSIRRLGSSIFYHIESLSLPLRGGPLSKVKKILPPRLRLGNIMARIRMIILFDLAKKHHALVCGTENKSEKLLGYFTRFGDAASDIEPISHLYKTQVYQLSQYLKIPQEVIDAKPTAGLWENQTDEGEFGFTYKEADQVLYQYFDKKLSINKIKKLGFKNTEKIIKRVKENQFKQEVPYIISRK